jgi:hypothetical protein
MASYWRAGATRCKHTIGIHRSLTRRSRNQTGLRVPMALDSQVGFRRSESAGARKAPEERKNVAHGVSHGTRRKPREPQNGAKERILFRPVPGLSIPHHPPSAYALGYILSPSGLPARTPRERPHCSRAAPPSGRQEHFAQAPIRECLSQLPAAPDYPSTLNCGVMAGNILPEIDSIQSRRYSRSRLRSI